MPPLPPVPLGELSPQPASDSANAKKVSETKLESEILISVLRATPGSKTGA
jgi:hypothetical protein